MVWRRCIDGGAPGPAGSNRRGRSRSSNGDHDFFRLLRWRPLCSARAAPVANSACDVCCLEAPAVAEAPAAARAPDYKGAPALTRWGACGWGACSYKVGVSGERRLWDPRMATLPHGDAPTRHRESHKCRTRRCLTIPCRSSPGWPLSLVNCSCWWCRAPRPPLLRGPRGCFFVFVR